MPELKVRRLALIACNVLWRELAFFASQSEAEVGLFFQPQGLHNDPATMRKRLQQTIDWIEAEFNYDSIIFGYGLCSNGIEGLVSKKTPLVFPRAHDCLTLLLGSQEKHERIAKEHPDAYWFSPGWIETGSMPSNERIDKSRKLLADRYGAENAEILLPELESWMRNYHKAIYIDLGVGPREKYLAYTYACAKELGWQVKEFLTVPPGSEVRQSYAGDIIKCRACTPENDTCAKGCKQG